jgi:dolichol-phosphate mannosyltransferase
MPELSVVIPTFNERENLEPLIARLHAALGALSWEAVFVDDDSPDGTASRVREIAQADPHIRAIQRLGRRGLSTAVIEGMLSTSGPFIAVMDCDLQHDERILPHMLAALKTGETQLVIASRYADGGDAAAGLSAERQGLSRLATRLAHLVIKAPPTDPMSGYFMIRRTAFEHVAHNLSGQGFKILLDLLASAPTPLRFIEVPYVFRNRTHGESKLDSNVMLEYLALIADKTIGRYIPPRFLLFGLVGGLGIAVHFAALALAFKGAHLHFELSQSIAIVVAMTSNFFLNNMLTYRDQRLRGWRMLRGLLSFYAICGLGAVANVGVASVIFKRGEAWWLAAFAGAIIGSVWNFAASSTFTWRKQR